MNEQSVWKQLYHKDVSADVEKLQSASYLSWAKAWGHVKEVDEKASYTIHEFPMMTDEFTPIEGITVPFLKMKEGYFVKVSVTIGGTTHSQMLPVMDNKNVPLGTVASQWVKPKNDPKAKASKEYAETPMPTTFDINKSHMRCLTKAIALHGLGLFIYEKEDLPREDTARLKEEALEVAMEIREYQGTVKRTCNPAISSAVDAAVSALESKAGVKLEDMTKDKLLQSMQYIKQKKATAEQEYLAGKKEQEDMEAAVNE